MRYRRLLRSTRALIRGHFSDLLDVKIRRKKSEAEASLSENMS
jgi:hypothetical protein